MNECSRDAKSEFPAKLRSGVDEASEMDRVRRPGGLKDSRLIAIWRCVFGMLNKYIILKLDLKESASHAHMLKT